MKKRKKPQHPNSYPSGKIMRSQKFTVKSINRLGVWYRKPVDFQNMQIWRLTKSPEKPGDWDLKP